MITTPLLVNHIVENTLVGRGLIELGFGMVAHLKYANDITANLDGEKSYGNQLMREQILFMSNSQWISNTKADGHLCVWCNRKY